ncbi:XF1762 family protein [Rhizorhabdus wittichii]|uniref:XF1762 family protein n=1 Tax=Rhizorhabdus wittichii TaxID=160791 RepID=UPI00036B00EA|nr:XF1762 family protein [Rhizorhabdus wittichii]
MGVDLRPVTRDEGRAFVRQHHRHHGWPTGFLWLHGLHDDDGELVGVAVVGRPVARGLDDGLTSEVTRCCTDTTPNAPSKLYAATERAARAKGYRRGLTYLLASEWYRFIDFDGQSIVTCRSRVEALPYIEAGNRQVGGASVRACGWRYLWDVKGRSWDTPGRPRTDKHPTEDKVAVGWGAWPEIITGADQ